MTLSEADNSLLQELSTKFDEMASRLSAQIADLSTQVDLLKRRSYEEANWRAVPLYDNVLVTTTRAGFKLFVDGRNFGAAQNLITDGLIEPKVTRLVQKLMPTRGVFLDIGANFGYYTLMAAQLGGPHARVFSIEPNTYLHLLILRSVYINGFSPRVQLHNCAASSTNGKAALGFLYDEIDGGGLALGNSPDPTVTKIEVDLRTVDEIVGPELVADCIKIDVEGHEYDVLLGMEALLRRSRDVKVILEFFEPNLGPLAPRILDFLDQLGFTVWKIDERGFIEDRTREELLGESYNYIIASGERPADRDIIIPAEDLHVEIQRDGQVSTPGAYLMFGPYCPLASGSYEVFLDGDVTGTVELAATHEYGVPIASRQITSTDQGLNMSFIEDIRYFAAVVRAVTPGAQLRLERLRLVDRG